MISVVIPTYNRAPLLPRCISSVLAQSYQDFEIIISDNSSLDNTREVVAGFTDSRIRFSQNESNLGLPRNLRKAVELARGDFVFYLGSDDILLRDALERTVGAFKSSSTVAVVARPWIGFFNDPARAILLINYPLDTSKSTVNLDDPDCLRILFRTGGQFSGLAYRREFASQAPGDEIFTTHMYPLVDALHQGSLFYLRSPTVAIQLDSSMTRGRQAEVYALSPSLSWLRLWQSALSDTALEGMREAIIKFTVLTNLPILEHLKIQVGREAVTREAEIITQAVPGLDKTARFRLHLMVAKLLPGPLLRYASDWIRLSRWAPSAFRARKVMSTLRIEHSS